MDAPLPEGVGGCSGTSLLSLPLGAGTVLDHLLGRLAAVVHDKVFVVSCTIPHKNNGNGGMTHQVGGIAVHYVTPENFSRVLTSMEACEHLLLVEPRCWPTCDYDFATLAQSAGSFRGVIHAVAVGHLWGSAWERLNLDAGGQVSRVQRLYDHVSWPEVAGRALLCSLVPARLVGQAVPLSLAHLRRELAARDVLTQDLPVPSDVQDLGQEAGILDLSEMMLERVAADPAGHGLKTHSPGVLMADGCQVHPSARLSPPVILQKGAVVERDAVVIGPTLVGRCGRIGRGAVVARSLLCADAVVGEGSAVSERVVVCRWAGELASNRAVPCERLSKRARLDLLILDQSARAIRQKRRHLQFALKRFMDVVFSSLALTVLSPVMLIIALLIKLTSKGGVFFVHRRETVGGREFPCLKFRTMVPNAHEYQRELCAQSVVDGPQFKLKHDPRITPLGRWLRHTNLDELPQLINVLLGHMSLVGPRPSPFRENQICVPWRQARLLVRPGITGLWQLCRDADRSKGGFHEWIFYDVTYVRDFSIWLDIKILIATLLSWGGKRHVPLSKLMTPPEGFEGAVRGPRGVVTWTE